MTPEEFVRRYSVLYHMAEDGKWESIVERGLLSTTALLDLFGVEGEARVDIESRRRPDMVEVKHPGLGTASIRGGGPRSR